MFRWKTYRPRRFGRFSSGSIAKSSGRRGRGKKAMSAVCDLILIHVERPGLDRLAGTKELYSLGYSGVIVTT